MGTINLPTDLLRTFVTVCDVGGYTKAGEIVGRTQPAVSLQMRRLEELFGAKLISQQGRQLKLTEAGELLVLYSRQILRLNDEAVAEFREPNSGQINVGIPTDYSTGYLQNTVLRFAEENPQISLGVRCDLSERLHTALEKDELDIVVAICPTKHREYLVRAWLEEVVWVTQKECQRKDPVIPIVAHHEGCEYRQRMIHALNSSERSWKIVLTSSEFASLQSAVEGGFGITATTKHTVTERMRVLTTEDGFPQLEQLRIGLLYKHNRVAHSGLGLIETLTMALDKSSRSDEELEDIADAV